MAETENSIIYSQKRKVSASFMDCTAKLGISHAAGMIQDNLTECFGAMGADNYRFNKEYNAFWVFTKTMVHFERRPDWEEIFLAETFPVNNAVFRTEVNSVFKDRNGKILLTANTECCCLDLTSHRPKKLQTQISQGKIFLLLFLKIDSISLILKQQMKIMYIRSRFDAS